MSTERPDQDGNTRGDQGAVVPRRRRSPLAVGSALAAVLLVGGGAAYVATAVGGEERDTADDIPPLALSADPSVRAPGPGAAGIAPGEPDPSGTTYRAEARLPEGPDSAAVYQAKGEVGADDVARLAKALGVQGTPRLAAGTWQVGSGHDAAQRVLRVTAQAPGTWTFAAPVPHGGDNCVRGKAECPAGSGQPESPVGEQAAKAAAAPVLDAVGLDDAKIDATEVMGPMRVVNADPEVGGLPTYGWTTGVRVGTDGRVVGATGRLMAPVKGESYPVLGADKTLDLLNKAHHGGVSPGDCAGPEPLAGQDKCGSARARQVPVKGADFGLTARYVSGRPALVPAWLFSVRPGGTESGYTVTHPAVDPAYLADGTPGSRGGGSADGPRLTSYNTNGTSLTVRFYGGVCGDYTASARESGKTVTVSVKKTADKGEVCVAMAKEITKTVRLDAPLGDRTVHDGTGQVVHQR